MLGEQQVNLCTEQGRCFTTENALGNFLGNNFPYIITHIGLLKLPHSKLDMRQKSQSSQSRSFGVFGAKFGIKKSQGIIDFSKSITYITFRNGFWLHFLMTIFVSKLDITETSVKMDLLMAYLVM